MTMEISRSKNSVEMTYATGKRKTSVARVWIMPGQGKFTVNKQPAFEYFKRQTQLMTINKPTAVTSTEGLYTIKCTVRGGGCSGQAGAVAHGISKAIASLDASFQALLRKAGMMTRDRREVERKKPGKKKARRSFQFSKR